MPKKRSSTRRGSVCHDVRFVEVEFPRPIQPHLVIEFSDGLSLLLENDHAIDLAAKFIVAFRSQETPRRKGGLR